MAFARAWISRCRVFPSSFRLVHLLSVATLVCAQTPPELAGPDPVKNFCSRWWSQSVVKNDILYVDSGIQKFNVSGDVYFGTNDYMLTIPLTEAWDWKKESNESQHITINTEPKNESNPNTGTLIPSLFRGYMFHGPVNTTDIYRFGGSTYMYNTSFEGYVAPESSSYPLWTYDYNAPGFPWDQHSVKQPWMPNHGSGADAIDHGLGFYLNGQIDMGTSSSTLVRFTDNEQDLYAPLEGMLVINLVDFTSANISTSKMRGNLPRVGGTMEYIAPVGSNGILVMLGGQIQPDTKSDQVANRNKGELIDFKSVDVFDIDSYFKDQSSNGTWYQQATNGEIPPPRIDFCTVSISAPDNSSHHIYLYGGINPITGSSYDDVVVLTMPSFTWTTVWPQGESPRYAHNCHIAGKRQMITVGGNITNNFCDWERKGVAVLDLSTIEWGSVFRTNTSNFQIPNNVLHATGGTINGNATIGEPATGWSDEGLKDIFWKSRWTVPTTWVSRPSPPKKRNVGAIAGGVVGGIVFVALLTLVLFALYRKNKKARSPAELHSDDAHHNELPGEKKKYELQGVNENDPAELAAPVVAEMESPREFVEADAATATRAAELPGTNVVPGGVTGVPIVRTPGDDLPESPQYTSGLRRPNSRGSSEGKDATKDAMKDADAQGWETREREDYFKKPVEKLQRDGKQEENEDNFQTPAEEFPEKLTKATPAEAPK